MNRHQRRRQAAKLNPGSPQAHAHELVANVATQMAAALYEMAASRSNLFRRMNPDPQAFVDRTWMRFLPQARHTLTEMLKRPGNEHLKDSVADALIKDAALMRGRTDHV